MKAYFNGQYNTLKYNEQIRSGITAMVDRAYNAKLLNYQRADKNMQPVATPLRACGRRVERKAVSS